MTEILVVVFDALRPEFVRPDLMPNLCQFAKSGVRLENSRSTFPTETRVNQTAVLTGCYPMKHGIVGNQFPDEKILPGQVINTGINDQIAAAFAKAPRGLINMPTLGERLAGAGRRLCSAQCRHARRRTPHQPRSRASRQFSPRHALPGGNGAGFSPWRGHRAHRAHAGL